MAAPSKVDTVIGTNSIFEGVFLAKGTLKIEGKFKGDLIDADQIYIEPTGEVESNIKGGSIFVQGKVTGNIIGKSKVVLEPGSIIEGDITTAELLTQRGVALNGRCNITQSIED